MTKTSKSTIARPVLDSMTEADLKATCKALGLKHGKTKKSAIAALSKAVDEGKAHFKCQASISFKPEGGTRTTYYGTTLRTYVSGPGKGNDVWLTPAAAVSGSPADTTAE